MSFSNIELHLQEYHNQELKSDDLELKDEVEEVGIALAVKTDDGRFECSDCNGRIFKSFKRFITHIKTHRSVSEDDIKTLEDHFTKKNLKNEDMCEKIGAIFRCKVCNSEFDTRKRLLLHISIHRNVNDAENRSSLIQIQKLISCQLCNRTFNSQAEHEMHMNAYHASHESHKIVKSLNRIKSSKGMHPCQYCDKEFKRPHEKVKHERVHTNEKPFACEVSRKHPNCLFLIFIPLQICGKTFRVTYCLSIHKRNVHSDERPYICTFPGCDKRFKAQGVYNHHINTHSTEKKYKCPFCHKSFKTSVQLAGHKNTHTKPFVCSICQRPFSALYSVKNHMATHKSGEPNRLKFVCDFCGASYAREFSLNIHKEEMHRSVAEYVIEETEVVNSKSEVYSVVGFK